MNNAMRDPHAPLLGVGGSENYPLGCFDANLWAKEFCRRFGGDESLMLSWFAGAIMTGYDRARAEAGRQLSPSEAVYGFAAWLTGHSQALIVGADADCAIVAERVAEFCRANDLIQPREGWQTRLVHPTDEQRKEPVNGR